MASSPTVLDWQDIGFLIDVCSNPIPSDAERYENLESARLELVHALHLFVNQWMPGQLMDNQTRLILVTALDSYSAAWAEWSHDVPPPEPGLTLRREDIAKRLRLAMAAAEAEEKTKKGPGVDGMLNVLLLVVLQQVSSWPPG